MGYYTHFEIEITDEQGIKTVDKIVEDIEQKIEKLSMYSFFMSGSVIGSDEPIKWYDYEDHMQIISKEYPTLLFTVDGTGENDDDIWKQYFLNGKSQKEYAIITFGKFDKTKLK